MDIGFIVIAVVIVYIVVYCVLPNHNAYVCPKCGKHFIPLKWKLVLGGHVGGAHLLKCPYCGKHSEMKRAPKDEGQ